MLRFRDGLVIRANSRFGNPFGTTLTVLGAMGGTIVLSKPAHIDLRLPKPVAERVPENAQIEIATLWKLGDDRQSEANTLLESNPYRPPATPWCSPSDGKAP